MYNIFESKYTYETATLKTKNNFRSRLTADDYLNDLMKISCTNSILNIKKTVKLKKKKAMPFRFKSYFKIILFNFFYPANVKEIGKEKKIVLRLVI